MAPNSPGTRSGRSSLLRVRTSKRQSSCIVATWPAWGRSYAARFQQRSWWGTEPTRSSDRVLLNVAAPRAYVRQMESTSHDPFATLAACALWVSVHRKNIAMAHLRSLALDALRRHWRVIFGRTPPAALSKDLLGRMIAYRLQEQAFGGLDRESLRFLDGLARHGSPPRRRLKPGTVLV